MHTQKLFWICKCKKKIISFGHCTKVLNFTCLFKVFLAIVIKTTFHIHNLVVYMDTNAIQHKPITRLSRIFFGKVSKVALRTRQFALQTRQCAPWTSQNLKIHIFQSKQSDRSYF